MHCVKIIATIAHLSTDAYAPCVAIKHEEALRKGQNVEQRVRGCMKASPEREVSCLQLPPDATRHPDPHALSFSTVSKAAQHTAMSISVDVSSPMFHEML
eukprot:SM000051S17617  [mRNA]  locus=s51:675813:676385:+ [translate_table: standard]